METITVDAAPTVTYAGPVYQAKPAADFPDLEVYKKYKMMLNPETAGWTDMQWLVQYHFDRSHVQRRAKTTRPHDNT